MFDRCAGVAIIAGTKVLMGKRSDGQGWGLPGGKQEVYETLSECAIRETQEELCITPKSLVPWGRVESEAFIKGVKTIVSPMLYVCSEYEGTETITKEMTELMWMDKSQFEEFEIFAPSKKFLDAYFKTDDTSY